MPVGGRTTVVLIALFALFFALALKYLPPKPASPPTVDMSLLKCVIVPPSSGLAPTASVIFAHGLGDSAMGWLDVAQMLSSRPGLSHVRFVLPNAPIQPVSLNMGMRMPSWFDIKSLDDVADGEDEAGLIKSSNAIKALVDAEESGASIPGPSASTSAPTSRDPVARNRVVLGGFSQGGAISYLAGLSAAFQDHKPVAGIAALSTWLPIRRRIAAWHSQFHDQQAHEKRALPLVPIFHAHGTADPVVQYSFGERSATYLREGDGLALGGFRAVDADTSGPAAGKTASQRWTGVQFKSYAGMPHSACPEEIEDFANWLEKVIPAQ